MFGKVFASLWHGTMMGQPDVQLVFVYMIANADRDGTLDQTPTVISLLTGIPLERVLAAIKVLESPDRMSRTPDEGGRRIARLDEHRDWGWRIVNYKRFRDLRDQEARRERVRESTRRWRERQVTDPVVNTCEPARSDVNGCQRCDTNADADADADGDAEAEAEPVPQASPSAPAPSDESDTPPPAPNGSASSDGFALALKDGSTWHAPDALLARLREAFPTVDLDAEFARMRSWLEANPGKRKTLRGAPRFVQGWCARAKPRPPEPEVPWETVTTNGVTVWTRLVGGQREFREVTP